MSPAINIKKNTQHYSILLKNIKSAKSILLMKLKFLILFFLI